MGKIKEILVVSHTHLDIGSRNVPGSEWNMRQRAFGRALDLCKQDLDNANPAALRWAIEISPPLLKFLQHASRRGSSRLHNSVTRGRTPVTAACWHLRQLIGYEGYVRFLLSLREVRARYGVSVAIVQH